MSNVRKIQHNTRVENPGIVLKRILNLVFSKHKLQCFFVLVCIIISSIASVMGSMFIRTLIDTYIAPLVGQTNPNFVPLIQALCQMALIYLIGVASTFTYNKILTYVTQGVLKEVRDSLFEHI